MEEIKNKLFVGNLPYSVTSEALGEMFAEAGEVTEAVVITDRETDRSKGFGFVTMASDEMAQKAIELLDNKDIDGRQIKVNIARPKVERNDR